MCNEAGIEEAFYSREGAVDELVDDNERAGRKILPQGADSGERQNLGDACPF